MHSTICLRTLRRDGFVSSSSGDRGGMMLTKPLDYPVGTLRINAKTADNGFIKVAVPEGEGIRDGEWPTDCHFDQAVLFNGDSLDHVVTWKSAETLEAFPIKVLRLVFWLKNADLYRSDLNRPTYAIRRNTHARPPTQAARCSMPTFRTSLLGPG